MIYANCSHTENIEISEKTCPVSSRFGSNYTTILIATGENLFGSCFRILCGGCSSSATKIKNNKTGFYNSKLYTRTTTRKWLFCVVLFCATLTQMFPEVDAVPLPGATDRDLSQCRSPDCATTRNIPKSKACATQNCGCRKRLIKLTDANLKFCSPKRASQLFPGPVPWQNPCSANAYDDHAVIEKRHLNLDPLKRHLKNMLTTKYGSCNSSDTDWCYKSQQYSFFEHSRRTDKLCLRLEHKRLQVYVAGLSYLNRLNENANLATIVQNAKTLLCEIETAINQTTCIKPPSPLSPLEMCRRLNLQSIRVEDQTGVDVIFAKANFGKYLRGLNKTLAAQRQPNVCGRPKPTGNRRRISANTSGSGRVTSSVDSSASNKSNQSKSKRRKNRMRNSAKPGLLGKNRGRAGRRGVNAE